MLHLPSGAPRAIAISLLMLVLTPAVALAQADSAPTPTQQQSTSGSFGFSPISSLDFLMPPIQDLAKGGIALVAGMEQSAIYTTTDPALTYDNKGVIDKVAVTRSIASGALALVVALVGLTLIMRSHRGQGSEDVRELVPRLVFGVAMLAAMPLLVQEAVDANNAMCAALGVDSIESVMPVNLSDDVGGALLVLLFVLAYLVLTFLLLFSMLTRLVALDTFIVLAPLAAVLWIHPLTQGYARLWNKWFIATVFGQFLMLATLRLATALPSSVMAAQDGTTGVILGIVVGIAELFFARRMLSFLASEGLAGSGSGMGMALAAAGLLLRRPGSSAAIAPVAAAAPGPRTTVTQIGSSVGSGWGSLAPRETALAAPSVQRALPAPSAATRV